MVLVSLSFPSYRKFLLFLSIAAYAAINSISCFARPVLYRVATTPYDNQLTRVRSILNWNGRTTSDKLSLENVNQWMTKLRAIPYGFSRQWKTPAEVENGATADCKGKAIALYQRMRANGAKNLFFVIGKHRADAAATHAWLEWQTTEGLFILDPTFNWTVTKALECNPFTYIPLYVYQGEQRYRATAPVFIAPNQFGTTAAAPAEFVQMTNSGTTFSHPQRSSPASSPAPTLHRKTIVEGKQLTGRDWKTDSRFKAPTVFTAPSIQP